MKLTKTLPWDSVLTATLVVCALVTTGLVVRREFFTPLPAPTRAAVQNPVFIQNWKSELTQGVRFGSASAPVQLAELADFECPACGEFHKTLKLLQERYPTQVSLTYVHFPLQRHRFALPAARAAECAGQQGRFEAMHNQLFEGQDKFGLQPWSEYARAAGVADLMAFDACTKETDPIPRIEEGKRLGTKLDIKGTPTLIVNGWLLGQPPTEEQLNAMVKAVLAGKSPVSTT